MSQSSTTHADEQSPATPSFRGYGGTAPENYERYFVPAIGAPLAVDLLELAALRTGEHVVDVACGTGVVAKAAASRVGATGSVAGVDLNPGMLTVAEETTPADVTIQWHQAGADALPLAAGSVDVCALSARAAVLSRPACGTG